MADGYTSSSGRPLATTKWQPKILPESLSFPNIDLIEMLSHLGRERIPERIVHAKGAAAYGEFEVSLFGLRMFCQ